MGILLVHVSREKSRLGSETYLAMYRHNFPSPGVVRGRGVKAGGRTKPRTCGQEVSHDIMHQDDGLWTRLTSSCTSSRGIYFVVGMRYGRGSVRS